MVFQGREWVTKRLGASDADLIFWEFNLSTPGFHAYEPFLRLMSKDLRRDPVLVVKHIAGDLWIESVA